MLWDVRLPRVVLAMLVGASLGCAGALMQGVFGNPLAEPGVIGVSTGAAVGAVAAIAFGIDVLGNWTVTVFAFVTGLFAARPFSALSGGERARVALARVLAQRAPLLLLDEPTAALDLRHQELVLGVCRARAAAGDAVVVVLHDLGLAADRAAVLHGGRIAADGPPEAVFAEESLSRVYQHPVEVLPHPETRVRLVVPRRAARSGR